MKKRFALIFTLVLCVHLNAQELPNITPPSPTAYELGKYGQIPVGMFTGTPNVSIPLYTYKTKNLSVPISLSYNSNGIKVDQLSSNVGLGWSLNVGGVVTRIIKGKSDEYNEFFFPEEEIHKEGIRSPMALDFFYEAGKGNYDTETDLFMYNFDGYSGKFTYSNTKEIVLVPHKKMEVINYFENVNGIIEIGFRITTPEGISYFFTEEELSRNWAMGGAHTEPIFEPTAWYLTKITHPEGDVIDFIYEAQNYDYDLSKSESVTIPTPTYQTTCTGMTGPQLTISPVITNNLRVVGKKLVEIRSNSVLDGVVKIDASLPHPGTSSSFNLVSNIIIEDSNSSQIEIFNFDYLTTVNNRVFLQEVIFKDPNFNYRFDYIDPEGLVGRLSTAQDHWGYFNGKTNNTHYFPNPEDLEFGVSELNNYPITGADKSADSIFAEKGLLKSINYPTKGYTNFTYEPNTFFGEDTSIINSTKDIVSLYTLTEQGDFGTGFDVTGTTKVIPFNQKASLSAYVSFNFQGCSEDLLKSKATITVTDDQTGTNIDISEITLAGYTNLGPNLIVSYNSPNNQFYVDIEEGHTYTVKLHPAFECVSSSLELEYYDQYIPNQIENIITGGLRIKDIQVYTSQISTPSTTRYFYGKKESLDESSGVQGQTAYYLSKQTTRTPCSLPGDFVDTYYTSLNSSSTRPLFNSASNSTTYYKYVTVSFGGSNFENGGEENEFIIHPDYQGNPLYGDPIESSTWVNAGWSNGSLKRRAVFKKDISNNYIVLKQSINNYLEDTRYFKKVYAYTVKKKFDLTVVGDVTYSCTQESLTKTFKYYYCSTDHKHWFVGLPWVDHWVCWASDSNNTHQIIYHPCFGKEIGHIITYPDYLENLDIMEYSTNSYWYYLNQKIETQYDQNGQNPVEKITNYYYDNPDHLQLTRTETTNSKNELLKSTISYPQDKGQLAGLSNEAIVAIDSLILQHRIAEPIQTEIYKDGVLLSQQRTNYKDWGLNATSTNNIILPETIQTSKGNNLLEDRITFQSYYDNGNVKEVSKVDGTHIMYVWGYQESQPIAKIENATFTNITVAQQTLIDDVISASDADMDLATETTLLEKLQLLREGFGESQVSSYTYDPLIGVTSITDPRGESIYYYYDDFNRLKFIKDSEGNILSENKYNYKN